MIAAILEKYIRNADLKEVVSKANSNFFLRLLGNVLAYLLVFSIVQLFGPNLYGQYSHSITIFLVFRLLSNFGIKPAVVRAFAEADSEHGVNVKAYYKKSLIILLITGLLSSAFLYGFAQFIADLYGKSYLASLIQILAFALLPYNLIDLNSAVFKGLRKIVHHTLLENIGNPLFSLITILISYWLFNDFIAVFYSIVFALAVLCFLSFVMLYRVLANIEVKTKKGVSYREILKVSLPMYLNSSLDLIGRWADILVLGFFCTDFQIGAYHLVSRLATAISVPLQALNSIITPKFRQLFIQNNLTTLKEVAQKSAKGTFVVAFLAGSALVIFGYWIIEFFEPAYVIAYSSLIVLVIGMVANSFFGSVLHLLNMTEGHMLLMRISTVVTAANIGLNLILIPELDIIGAAISTSCSIFMLYFLAALYCKKRLKFLPYAVPSLKRLTLKKY
tara:strand:+ start:4551 stop:5891 length:1341 start_codon:yes stop_codon:yes gene_type:complete